MLFKVSLVILRSNILYLCIHIYFNSCLKVSDIFNGVIMLLMTSGAPSHFSKKVKKMKQSTLGYKLVCEL